MLGIYSLFSLEHVMTFSKKQQNLTKSPIKEKARKNKLRKNETSFGEVLCKTMESST